MTSDTTTIFSSLQYCILLDDFLGAAAPAAAAKAPEKPKDEEVDPMEGGMDMCGGGGGAKDY